MNDRKTQYNSYVYCLPKTKHAFDVFQVNHQFKNHDETLQFLLKNANKRKG